MTDDAKTTSPPDSDAANSSTHHEAPTEHEEKPSREELRQELNELRAEMTRLRAQQAQASTTRSSWVQRHPILTLALSAGLGAAAGYGASTLLRPRPPRTLSAHARQRLERLTDEAAQIAGRLRKDWGDRAAKGGKEVRRRAAEVGRQLAREAQAAGENLREEAKTASSRARKEASAALREATEKASERVRSASGSAAEQAEKVVEEQVEALTDAADPSEGGPSVSRVLLTVGGVLAGGYLASKVRQWM